MPIILTGAAGDSGAKGFVSGLQAGQDMRLRQQQAQRDQDRFELQLSQAQQELEQEQQAFAAEETLNQLGQQGQLSQADALNAGQDAFGEGVEAFGGLLGPAGAAAGGTLKDVLQTFNPESRQLFERVMQNDPASGRRLMEIQAAEVQAQQVGDLMRRYGDAETAGVLPQGSAQQAADGLQNQGITAVELERQLFQAEDKAERQVVYGEANAKNLARLDAEVEMLDPDVESAEGFGVLMARQSVRRRMEMQSADPVRHAQEVSRSISELSEAVGEFRGMKSPSSVQDINRGRPPGVGGLYGQMEGLLNQGLEAGAQAPPGAPQVQDAVTGSTAQPPAQDPVRAARQGKGPPKPMAPAALAKKDPETFRQTANALAVIGMDLPDGKEGEKELVRRARELGVKGTAKEIVDMILNAAEMAPSGPNPPAASGARELDVGKGGIRN